MKTENLFDIQVANVTMDEAVEHIAGLIEDRKPCYIGGLNVNQILLIEQNPRVFKIAQNAAMIFPDGQPVLWMAKSLKRPLKQKISGPDLMVKVCELAAKRGYRVYLLGGAEGSPEKASQNLQKMFPSLEIAGTYSPPFGFEQNPRHMRDIMSKLKQSKADILFVGLGSPKQDIFIDDNMKDYNIPVSFSIGISIDFISGKVKRAPKWMRCCGLEWFHRMLQDPKRLVKRYFIDDLQVIKIYRNFKKNIS